MSVRLTLVPFMALGLVVAFGGAPRAAGTAHEGGETFDQQAALQYSQAAVGRVVGDHTLLDRQGRAVALAELGGRPLVVSLVYTSCAHTCPIVTQTLGRAVEVARDALGARSFTVATIGFDTPVDTPERMAIFAREQGVELDDWLFLSTDAETMSDLAHDLGFVYFRSAKGFDHINQTTVLDGSGRIVKQIYGQSFEPPALVEPLKELALGRPLAAGGLSDLIERVRLFCTLYDPKQDRYRFDYSIFVAFAAGVASLGAVAVFLVRAWRQGRSKGPVF